MCNILINNSLSNNCKKCSGACLKLKQNAGLNAKQVFFKRNNDPVKLEKQTLILNQQKSYLALQNFSHG
jgi:hypothetical protein